MWKDITYYKTPSPSTLENQKLADDFNEFYCRFENTPHTHPERIFTQPLTPPATPLSPTPALKISEDDVHQVFRENKRGKAPGPDSVSPACLKTCADKYLQQITGAVRSPLMLQTLHHHPRPKATQNDWT